MNTRQPLTAVRQLRSALGMTQAELASLLGVTQPQISAWERGRRSPTAAQLARLNESLLDGSIRRNHTQRLARQLERMQAGMALFAPPGETQS
jgi:transcriptional regulator with XRE-family HTH domain